MVAELPGLGLPFVVRDPPHLLWFAVAAEVLVEPLDCTAVGAELIVASVEQHILAQRAFQRSVQHRDLDGRFQADVVEVLGVGTYEPGVPSGEIAFQVRADGAEHLRHVFLLDAMVVGRIRHQAAALGVVGPVGHWLAFDLHHILHLGVLDVAAGYCYGLRVDVAASDLEVEWTLGAVVVVEFLEEFLVEIRPLLEGEAGSVYSGIDVGGDECGLDQERAGPAHGVGEVRVAAPSGGHDYSGSQDLVDRGLGLLLAVSAFVKGLAAGIQRDGDAVAVDVDIEQQVIARHADRGTLAVQVAEVVDDAVLDAVGGETAVGEIGAVDRCVDCECGLGSHVLLPRNITDNVVELVRIRGREFLNGLQHPEGCSKAKVCAVHQFEVTLETYHTRAHLDVLGSETEQFVAQYRFQSLEGFGNH